MNVFLTFGAGDNFISASQRLASQACRTGIFHEINTYTGQDLKNMPDFWKQHGKFITENKRMFGYGIWKPYLVLKTMEKLQDGDSLFYADSGCEFDLDCENVKANYEILTQRMELHTVYVNATNCNHDRQMNKMDLVDFLDMTHHPGFLEDYQIQATTFLIVKNNRTIDFVKQWYEVCCNYHMIDDTSSVLPNIPEYNEHRHDQSVFSLLMKKMNLANFSVLQEFSLDYLICLNRNRSGSYFPACRVTGSDFYDLYNGNEFVDGKQIIHMSKLIHGHRPKNILETGFSSGRATATMVKSCQYPIEKYVNCDQSYENSSFFNFFVTMCPYITAYEKRSQDLFRDEFFEKEFPKGIDWFTVDGDNSYEGVLFDLVSVFPYMKNKGIIYLLRDQKTDENVKKATDFFGSLFVDKLIKHTCTIQSEPNKTMVYFVVKKF
tara:strand:+ start:181 stop:1485 length:1305 start_codon:yes stop_codon:yes gene_type:complete